MSEGLNQAGGTARQPTVLRRREARCPFVNPDRVGGLIRVQWRDRLGTAPPLDVTRRWSSVTLVRDATSCDGRDGDATPERLRGTAVLRVRGLPRNARYLSNLRQ